MARITLEAARVNKGMTQEELAQKMGVSRQTIISWEKGDRPMKPAYLYMFCGIVGMTENDILLPINIT